MANIFCRSPFIIQINEANQIETKIELFIWNGSGSAPASPTYTISKLIPSTSNRETLYNISPYLREFITHSEFENNYNVGNDTLNTDEWCNVSVKRYKKLTTSFTQVGTTTTYKVFDGYTNYVDGYNYDLGNILLDEGTYHFEYDANATLSTDTLKRAGSITWNATSGYKVKYTELVTGTTNTVTIPSSGVISSYRVHPNYYDNGCLTQITDASNNVLWEATFKPVVECKYTPMVIDFVNRYGAWQREFFFKASKNTVNTTNTTYNLLQSNLYNFDTLEGQRKVFNTVMLESVTCNSDWRDDDYAEVIRQLLMSERVLLNNRPVRVVTNSIELQKQINTKMINYAIDFEYSTDINNTVV
jgi:hypothetical protein